MTLPSRRASDQPAPLLSIVVPMYNEEEGTDLFFNRLTPVLEQITDDYEIVCVDDGSSDRTMFSLMQHHARDPRGSASVANGRPTDLECRTDCRRSECSLWRFAFMPAMAASAAARKPDVQTDAAQSAP